MVARKRTQRDVALDPKALHANPAQSHVDPCRRPRPSQPLGAGGQLLDGPAVAIRIAEEHERSPIEALDVADVDAVVDEVGAGGLDVIDDELKALGRARRSVDDTDAESD